MYRIENLNADNVHVTHSKVPYSSVFVVASASEAESIVVGLNQPDMLTELAAYRFERETGGLELAGGLRILTDRESQGQLNSAFTTLQNGLVPDTDWKAANGWEVVTLEQIKPIATAVAAHVRACFRGECRTETAILAATTVAEIEAIEIRALFDATYAEAFAEVMALEAEPA